ncbi:Bug family tripartite tricarboxylate transporter substrate binding protein [Alcaligenes endophyticus]|uniref:Tripartite tricarboxylate transporter substrate binding protein n=1 Tax=Alcaligenes endophyticus TaxID=1929088 RepID=A0ABT8EKY5_9BURK|nr:tripartite tricarboxylate transporter substrate binding protein [Alcaligenes endophyticus]MCX5590674.1 tripartite tricarboxylate transporter substrate binding protein [Alcaligenes endophyticus]MDN4121962.1 tripartite tricarboxylate transporter substrate binding protein [Alcaligenes endophyticus]
MFKTSNTKITRRTVLGFSLSASALSIFAALPVHANEVSTWPERPVTLIVPFAAGGPTDVTGRIIGEGLSKIWGKSVVVENRPGAGGTIGSGVTARAAKDGYTLVLGVTGSHGIAGALYENLPYNPSEDFEAVAKVVLFPNAIFANPSVPANNLQELIQLAKEDKKYQIYGTDGLGTASHLTMALLGEQAGAPLEPVHYKGSTPLITDVIGNFAPFGITGMPSVEPHVEAGKLKLIAITTDQDYSKKGYATIAEQGFPDFSAAPWSGVFAPKGTPRPVIEKIATDIQAVLATPEVISKLASLGVTPVSITLEEFEADLKKEQQAWEHAVKTAGIERQ